MPVLLIIKENNIEKRVKLTARPLILGRSSKCHVQIEDQMCSGKHCAFKLNEQFKVLVKDLESTNGTYLNDGQIMDSHLMLDDVIKIGECEISIDRSELSPKEKSVLTRDEPTAHIKFMELPSEKKVIKPSQVVRAKQQSQSNTEDAQKKKVQPSKKFFPEKHEQPTPPQNKTISKPTQPKEEAKSTNNTSLKDRLAARGKKISEKKVEPTNQVANERQIDLEESSGDTKFIKLDSSLNIDKKKEKSSFRSKIKKAFKK